MAFNEASIFARTNGYLKAWYTDIGAKVTEGQVMAEIEAPDVDAQLRQANGGAGPGEGQPRHRQPQLRPPEGSARQEGRQPAGVRPEPHERRCHEGCRAGRRGERAEPDRAAGFPEAHRAVRRRGDAPQHGRGRADQRAGGGQELFRVARTDILRVYVYVPQAYAAFVQGGSKAFLEFAEFPGEKFEGKVANIAGAMDPATRTLQTEIQVDNKEGRLFPGAFANAHLFLPLKKAPTVDPGQHAALPQGGHAGRRWWTRTARCISRK